MIKVHYCGICGSDVYNFKYKLYQIPLILGHEISGEVAEIGENITDMRLGDEVIAMNVLLDIIKGELRGLGIFENGGFAEYVKVQKRSIFYPPKSISSKSATMIETFANITRAIKLSRIEDNQKILIIGGGNIGLAFLTSLLCEKNPKYVVMIEPYSFLREKAIDFRATDAFPPSKVKIRRFLKTNGSPTYIFDTVGNEKTLLMNIELIQRGGTILLEGIQKGRISLATLPIINKEICLKGALGHDREDILASIDLFAKNKIDPEKFISEIVPLKEIQKAFQRFLLLGERDFIKILVEI